MEIRQLTPADAESYVALRREMLADAPWAFSASLDDDRGVQLEQVRSLLGASGNGLIGAFDSERLSGVAGLIREPKLKRSHIVGIWGVYVTPTARSRGIAKSLIAAAIEIARRWEGVARIQLSVSENSPKAQKVYESLGFREWGREPDALRTGGRSFTEIHMSLQL